ncbi:hypothetical protein R0131_18375 [Clostridium sp. AL.422]|uniref:hypothetical protein n=1 Tax=Clostridium TaxID=1485 RepID=UPI00293DD5A7|nr:MULTISPECIES: hypothetical protein [unclassified Clostridium]MDV4152796.1 hypothetical protein [Clostridium sp. AL.422]
MKAHLTKETEEDVPLEKEYALQLPNSYVEIDRDEMEYIDGGLKISSWIASAAIDVGLAAIGGWNVTAIGWLMGQGISILCSKISKVIGGKLLGNVLKSAIFQTTLGAYITSKIGIIGTALGMTSLGGMISTCWDAWDRNLDGYINI